MDVAVERLRSGGDCALAMGSAMAGAFLHEPNFVYLLPDEARRERALRWFFGSFVSRVGLACGQVHAATDGAGGAVWIGPGAKPSLSDTVRAGVLAMPLRLGPRPTLRAAHFDLHLERVRREAAPARHWYLAALGVSPERRGEGLGTALLKPVLDHAASGGIPCYLETFRESTTEFYARFGFVVLRRGVIPGGGPTFWCMERPAGTPEFSRDR